MAVLGLINVAAFFTITVPLFVALGMQGLALGWLMLSAVTLSTRTYYLKRVFPGFSMGRHALRAMLPSVPAVGVILVYRALVGSEHSLGGAIAALVAYGAITVVASFSIERALLREVISYVRPRPTAAAPI
jgi:hypothetical protein